MTFEQAYNAQAAVDHESQVIVAADVIQTSTDKNQLAPMVERSCDNLQETPEVFSADAGYWVEEDLALVVDEYEIDVVVAPGRIRHSEWRGQGILTGEPPPEASRKERMWHRLRTAEGRAEYDKRKVTVEPVFGQIKEARGFRRFSFRGHQRRMAMASGA